jgi:pilus assembly protein FimV
MLDIQRLNPEAFIDGNINRIKAGYIIYLPAPGDSQLSTISPRRSRKCAQQNRAFAAGPDARRIRGGHAARVRRTEPDPDGRRCRRERIGLQCPPLFRRFF